MNNTINPFKPANSQGKKPFTPIPDSFVEALKDLGSGTAKSVTTNLRDGAKNAIDQLTGRAFSSAPTPDAFEWQRQQLEQERQLRLEEQRTFERRHRQEFLVFSQKEEARKQEITSLQEQLKLLVEEVKGLSQEIDVAVSQQIVNPGVYHVNFFERLRLFIKLMRKKIQDSQTWLSLFNHRDQQKGYWGQVQTAGTKFMLSQERYMVTQTG